jgi:hypothetical protein
MPENWAISYRVGVDRNPEFAVVGANPEGTGGGVIAWHVHHHAAVADSEWLQKYGWRNVRVENADRT